jgi:hypothetical protein
MSTEKGEAIALIERLPDGVSVETIITELRFREAAERSVSCAGDPPWAQLELRRYCSGRGCATGRLSATAAVSAAALGAAEATRLLVLSGRS